jgi:hypothetical protein
MGLSRDFQINPWPSARGLIPARITRDFFDQSTAQKFGCYGGYSGPTDSRSVCQIDAWQWAALGNLAQKQPPALHFLVPEDHENTPFFPPAHGKTTGPSDGMMAGFYETVQFNLLFEFKPLTMHHRPRKRMMGG